MYPTCCFDPGFFVAATERKQEDGRQAVEDEAGFRGNTCHQVNDLAMGKRGQIPQADQARWEDNGLEDVGDPAVR